MNILITGINGFVGSNLIFALYDHEIYGISSNSYKQEGIKKIYSWNELNKIPSVDVVIHLAGKAHDIKNQSERQAYFEVNTGLTQRIFDWFVKSPAKTFIFFSSVKAAADTVHTVLVEEMPPMPKGAYGESKLKAEEYIKNTWDYTVNQLTKQVYILRPCMIHGPGNKGNLNLLYNLVHKGMPWPLGDFDNQRSFVSMDNVIYIIRGLLEQDIASGIYNVADDEALSTNELVQIMCETMSRKCRIWYINKKIMITMAMVGSLLHLPLNQERLKKLTENYVVSNEKIKKAFHISRLPLAARDGFIKTIRSFE